MIKRDPIIPLPPPILCALPIAPLIGVLRSDDCYNAEGKVIMNDVHIILGTHRTRFQGFRLVKHEIMSASELILGEEGSLLLLSSDSMSSVK